MLSKLLNYLLVSCILLLPAKTRAQTRDEVVASILKMVERSKKLNESTPDSALVVANQALLLANSEEIDSLKGKIHVAISTAYSYQANYNQSAENSFKALEYAAKFRDTLVLIDAYNNLGIDFLYQDDYVSSEKYFGNVERLSRQFGDSLRLGHALNNLGLIEGYQGQVESELAFYEQARSIFSAIHEKEGYANTLQNMGTAFTTLGEYGKASSHYRLALDIYEELGYATAIEQTLQSMAENNFATGKYGLAFSEANRALEVTLTNRIVLDLPFIYDLLANISAAQGNYERAYSYQSQCIEIQDSLYNAEKSLQLNELKTRYETEQKQQQIELLTTQNKLSELSLSQKNREQYVLVFAIFFLVVVGGLVAYILATRSRLKQQLLSQEIENLKLSINSLVEGSTEGLDIDLDKLNKRLISPLSEREFEILMLAVSDQNNGEIAEKLFVSVNTVKFHLKNIYEKLGVSNRKEALQFAINPNKS
jgi:DNA-binding CsgD family transcriptional regulator